MEKKLTYMACVFTIGMLILSGFAVMAKQPILPHERYGVAKIDGSAAPDGSEISAWIHGVKYGSNETYFGDGTYKIETSGDDSSVQTTKYGGLNGDPITYRINTADEMYIADESDTFHSGESTKANLTFSSTEQPNTDVKINEIVTQPADNGSQYVYIYQETSIDPANWKLSIHDGWEATLDELTTLEALNNLYVDLGASDVLNTGADHLMLSWIPENTDINGGNPVVMDRVEYGYQDTQPDNTTLVDHPGSPGIDEGLIRSSNGTDTNNCNNDFELAPATPRATTVEYGVSVTAPTDAYETTADQYSYDFDVENIGSREDTYDLAASSSNSDWSASAQSSNVTVSAGSTSTVTVEVTIPSGVTDGDSSEISLEATSQVDSSINDLETMTVTYAEAGVTITAPSDTSESTTGTKTYDFDVENTGDADDTYDLMASSSNGDWSASAQSSSISVPAGTTSQATVEVMIPDSASHTDSTEVTLEAVSKSDGTVSDSDTMTVTYDSGIELGVAVKAPNDQISVSTGTQTYNFTVENTADSDDTYDLSATSSKTDWTVSTQSDIPVPESGEENVSVEVTIPDEASDSEESVIELKATSQTDDTVNDSDSMTLTYNSSAEMSVSVTPPSDQTETSVDEYSYEFEVENTGDVSDTYDLSVSSSNSSWSASSRSSSVDLSAGDTSTVTVNVTIPSSAANGDSIDIALEAISQTDDTVTDSDSMTLTFSIDVDVGVSVTAPDDKEVDSTGEFTYTFTVENTGETKDTFDLSASSSGIWTVDVQGTVEIEAGSEKEVDLDVTIPEDASNGDSSDITLEATSQTDSSESASDTMKVTYSSGEGISGLDLLSSLWVIIPIIIIAIIVVFLWRRSESEEDEEELPEESEEEVEFGQEDEEDGEESYLEEEDEEQKEQDPQSSTESPSPPLGSEKEQSPEQTDETGDLES